MPFIIKIINLGKGKICFEIYDKFSKKVYEEIIKNGWEDETDIEMTGLEICKARGFWPAIIFKKQPKNK